MYFISPPFPQFFDTAGKPLENGKIYIGVANQNPETNPITVYWDAAGTIPAAQPIRTIGGYPARNGSASKIFVAVDHSITVKTKSNALLFYSATSNADYLRADLATSSGSSLLGHSYAQAPAYLQVLSDILNGQPVSVKRFFSPSQNANLTAGTEFDVSATVESSLNSVLADSSISVFFPKGKYYFGSACQINTDSQMALRIYGESTRGFFAFDNRGTIFYGAAGIESFLTFTKTNLAVAGGYSFEAHNLTLKSALAGAGGAICAFKNKVAGAPASAFEVHHCNGTYFDKVIINDISAAIGLNPLLTTGIAQVGIHHNNFVANNYAMYASGGIANIIDLNFHDNKSENGGKVYIDGLGGTFNISDNMLEGQNNAIELVAGLANGSIERNYFEANSGYLYRFVASNPNSSLITNSNYIQNSSASLVTVQNCKWINDDEYEANGVIAGALYTSGKSQINNTAIIRASESALVGSGIAFADLNTIPRFTSVLPASLTSAGYNPIGGATQLTPIGTVEVNTIAGALALQTTAITLATGDWFVCTCLARKLSAASVIYMSIYNNAGTLIGSTDNSQTIRDVAIGEWVFSVFWVQATASSAGVAKFRFTTTGGNVDVTRPYLYKVASAGGSSALYCVLPN